MLGVCFAATSTVLAAVTNGLPTRMLKLPPALLVTDFDSTITVKDTLGSLVALASDPGRFAEASELYTARFAEVEALVEAGKVEEALSRAEEVENTSIDLVVEAGMLTGISRAAIAEASRPTPLRPGTASAGRVLCPTDVFLVFQFLLPGCSGRACSAPCATDVFLVVRFLLPGAADALRAAAASGVGVHICSANWSPDWIVGALFECGDALSGIHTNALEMDGLGVCTGGLKRSIVGPADKARCFARLRAESSAASRDGRACVFVGDALPDLTAMLDADIGILIGENALMRTALAAVDGAMPLRALSEAAAEDGSLRPGLYVASCWDDITQVLQLGSRPVALALA